MYKHCFCSRLAHSFSGLLDRPAPGLLPHLPGRVHLTRLFVGYYTRAAKHIRTQSFNLEGRCHRISSLQFHLDHSFICPSSPFFFCSPQWPFQDLTVLLLPLYQNPDSICSADTVRPALLGAETKSDTAVGSFVTL